MLRLLRIIVLDSDLSDVRRLRRCLDALSDTVASLQHLGQGSGVIERVQRMEGDVLFIDEDLDRLTGVEAIRALRTAGEARPIIATTRIDCGYLAAGLMRAGADGYLAKGDLDTVMVGRALGRAMRTARGRNVKDRLRRSALRHLIAEQGGTVVTG